MRPMGGVFAMCLMTPFTHVPCSDYCTLVRLMVVDQQAACRFRPSVYRTRLSRRQASRTVVGQSLIANGGYSCPGNRQDGNLGNKNTIGPRAQYSISEIRSADCSLR
ncbi:hypothetical protein EDB86DRAFT_1723035 [Lactarius hatsudake]|nr:hypothetical protein EDB86DRAFT_1723035 [Lactarius hatsudake]